MCSNANFNRYAILNFNWINNMDHIVILVIERNQQWFLTKQSKVYI